MGAVPPTIPTPPTILLSSPNLNPGGWRRKGLQCREVVFDIVPWFRRRGVLRRFWS